MLLKCQKEVEKLFKQIQELFPRFYEEIKAEVKEVFINYLKNLEVKDNEIKSGDDKVVVWNGAIELSVKSSEHPRYIAEIEIKVEKEKFKVISTFEELGLGVRIFINKSDLEKCEEEKKELEQIISGNSKIVYVLELGNKQPPKFKTYDFGEILKKIAEQD